MGLVFWGPGRQGEKEFSKLFSVATFGSIFLLTDSAELSGVALSTTRY